MEAGESHYFTGRPCRSGHLSRRRTAKASCLECERVRMGGVPLSVRRARENRLYAADPRKGAAKARVRRWRNEYGVDFSTAEFEALSASQGERCAICNRAAKLCLDHCHDSRVVRGLLCNACNIAIGLLDDDAARLNAAADYLRRHQLPRLEIANGRK